MSKKKKEKQKPVLRFTPYAWAKLLYFLDAGSTEVGGFGVSGVAEDPLLVTDFAVVKQKCSVATVKFDDTAVADFMDDAVDGGKQPWQASRIWIHTHPSISPQPSMTDEMTFDRAFGSCDWSVMCIVARDQKLYARITAGGTGPSAEQVIPVEIDFRAPFGPSDKDTWEKEYKEKVTEETWQDSIALEVGVGGYKGAPLTQGGQVPPKKESLGGKYATEEAWRKECYGAGVSPPEQRHKEFMGADGAEGDDEAAQYAHELGYTEDLDDWWKCLSDHEQEALASIYNVQYDWNQGVWYYEPIE